MSGGAWAIPYNNPMAIIQPVPDKWQGLVGDDRGRLKFTSMPFGVRAGVINLYNGYFKKGNNTLKGIFEVYAPSGHGGNNPLVYAQTVGKKIGVDINKKLDFWSYGKALSRAIIQVETGKDISNSDFEKGWQKGYFALTGSMDGGELPGVTVTPKKKTNLIYWGLGALSLFYLLGLKNKKNGKKQ